MLKLVKPHFWLSVAMVLCSMFLLAGKGSAEAAPAKPFKIGIVNRMQILEQSQEGQVAKNQLEKEKNEKQKELDKIQDELKRLQDELEKQGALLSEEKKREKEELLVRKGRDLKRLFEDYNRELSKRQDELLGSLMVKLNQVVKDYGQEQGFSLILDSTLALYQGSDIDVTPEVLKRFNLIKR